MSRQWHVKTKNGKSGPISSSKLKELAASGKIFPGTPVSPNGEQWVRAESIKGLSFFNDSVTVEKQSAAVSAEEITFADNDPMGMLGDLDSLLDQIAVPVPAPTAHLVKIREQLYNRIFGPFETVYHETTPIQPHIDVYVHPPHGDRNWTTLVTGGMSDHPMPAPPGTRRRAELLLYVPEPKEEYIRLLRFLAQMPYKQNTWFSWGSSVSNGNPPRPIFKNSPADCFLFMLPLFDADFQASKQTNIVDGPLALLQVMPISSAERQVIIDQGIQSFAEIFFKTNPLIVLDEQRRCCTTKKRWFR